MKLSASLFVVAAIVASLMPTASAIFSSLCQLSFCCRHNYEPVCCTTGNFWCNYEERKEYLCTLPSYQNTVCCPGGEEPEPEDCKAFGDPTLFEFNCDFGASETIADDWDITDGGFNTLALDYEYNGVDANTDFTTTIGECDSPNGNVGAVYFSDDGTPTTPATTVTYQNTQPVGNDPASRYCSKVTLFATTPGENPGDDPILTEVANGECKIDVEANEQGDEMEVDGEVDTFVQVNNQTIIMVGDNETRTADFTVTCVSPIAYNQFAQLYIEGQGIAAGWWWEITAVESIGCGTTEVKEILDGAPADVTIEQGRSEAYFQFSDPDDFPCFAPSQTINLKVSATWYLTDPTRRALGDGGRGNNLRALGDGQGNDHRELQDGQPQQSGQIEQTIELEVDSSSVPSAFGASAADGDSKLSLSFATAMAAAGVALVV